MTIDDVIEMLNSEDCKFTTNICLMSYRERDCCKCILKEYTKTVYNKAIDDFAEKLHHEEFGNEYGVHIVLTPQQVDELAEQLKEKNKV